MNIDNTNPLLDYVVNNDILGSMRYLKQFYGVSEGFICNKSNVNLSTYSRYKKGEIKSLGKDKRDALINTVKEMYLS